MRGVRTGRFAVRRPEGDVALFDHPIIPCKVRKRFLPGRSSGVFTWVAPRESLVTRDEGARDLGVRRPGGGARAVRRRRSLSKKQVGLTIVMRA